MRSLSRKTVAWATGAAVAVGGGTAGIVIAAQSGGQAPRASAVGKAHAVVVPPLRLVSVTPAAGGKGVNGATDITVTYNRPLPATAPLPALSPAIAGSWQRTGDSVTFTPETGFPASTRVTVMVKGTTESSGRSGSSSFTTGKYSTLRLQEVLAQLGYLPLTWTPTAAPAQRGTRGRPPRRPPCCPRGAGQRSCRRRTRRRPGPSGGRRGTRRGCAPSGRRASPTRSTGGPSPGSRPTTGCPPTG